MSKDSMRFVEPIMSSTFQAAPKNIDLQSQCKIIHQKPPCTQTWT